MLSPDFIFRSIMHQKRLVVGLRPVPLEKHSASSETLTAISSQGFEHSLAGIRGAVWLRLVGKDRVRSLGRNGKGEQGERVGKRIQTHHCQRPHFRRKMYQKMFGGRAPPAPARELERSSRPLTVVGAMEGNTL